MSPLSSRPYSGSADLELLIEFASEMTAARWPAMSPMHPGDIVWQLMGTGGVDGREPMESIRLWLEGERLQGYAYFDDPAHVLIDVRLETSENALFDEIVIWAEGRRAASLGDKPLTLSTTLLDRETTRSEALLSHEFRRTERGSVRMRQSLAQPTPKPVLPAGMRFGDGRDIDIEKRAVVHADAWSHLAEIGMPAARSKFTPAVYDQLQSAPLYDPALDLVVETANGAYAACTIGWADVANGIGLFEPVGTRPAFRKQGLARALTYEGMRRFRERGLRTAHIGTANFNHPARATYESAGFVVLEEEHVYVKRFA